MKARILTDGRRRIAQETCDIPCSVERGMRILGGKWTGSILWHLKDGPVRFNDLSRMLEGASKKMLTERLRQLEDQGLVNRRVSDTRPVTVNYTLTDVGRSAIDCIAAVSTWAETVAPAGVAD